ncbi:MAG: response regulator [Bacteroidota bacterium]|nr:response regulator [Bacteroidota bacterium]MEC8884437.1 response regulator [Bacteroidota bacterium]MEE3225355.1 response regulator [Bacteroidota bacterium]
MKGRVLTILLIEDDRIEIMKLKRVLAQSALKHHLIEAKNGEEALHILEDKNALPDIILLDLNMPKINGIEFLKILKADAMLKYIPTIILTTSSNHNDVKQCYEIGIAGYVLKPLKYEDYVSKITNLLNYWSLNELIHT